MLQSLSVTVLYGLYVFAFGLVATVCFWMVLRTRSIQHTGTRQGLFWLLLTSGGWAASHVAYLIAPTEALQYAFYEVGLIVGLASVGPWLYFCSAYTGRSLHRNPRVQRAFVAVFLLIVAVKLTNPLHHWYFVAETVQTPFAYLQIRHRILHWIVMGLAYALSAVGFFMLFELFVRVGSDTKPLFVLLGLTGLPVVFDVASAIFPGVLNLTYSSIGVAVFSLGVFSVYFDRFQFVRVAGESDDPIVVVDDEGEIRDFNARARRLFPALADGLDEPLERVAPGLADALDDEEPMYEADVGGQKRYYSVASNPFTTGGAQTGQSIVLTDVTERERYRRELETKNEKLEQFASIVSHDLRNPLQVASGRTELAMESGDVEHLEAVVRAHDRMAQLIEEMLTLAREGVSIAETERISIPALARQAWAMIDADEAELVVADGRDGQIDADPERLQQLFENLFRNALQHGGDDVTVTVGFLDDGFYVADDGSGIPEEMREEVFDAGVTTASDGTGFGLAIVSEIVEAHGWEISVGESRDGGARFEIVGVGGESDGADAETESEAEAEAESESDAESEAEATSETKPES